ncbi:MAG: DUF6799 domain-containing protein [Ginsengibacter sp.]
MKTITLFVVAIAFCFSASAQVSHNANLPKKHHQMTHSSHSYYTMQNGKLMMSNNGTMSAVTNDVTLSNGTTISTDGKVTWKNGKTEDLQNGQRIGSNGKIWSKTQNKGKMHMPMKQSKSPMDSTR